MTETIPNQVGVQRQHVKRHVVALVPEEMTMAAMDRWWRSRRPAVESAHGRGIARRAITRPARSPPAAPGGPAA